MVRCRAINSSNSTHCKNQGRYGGFCTVHENWDDGACFHFENTEGHHLQRCSEHWPEGLPSRGKLTQYFLTTMFLHNAVQLNATEIDVQVHGLGDDGAFALVVLLPESAATLKKLSLTGNEIGDEGITAVARVLPACTSLTELNVGDNSFHDDGAAALANALPDCSALKRLDLNDSAFGNIGAKAIALALRRKATLVELNWGHSLANLLRDSLDSTQRAMSDRELLTYWRSQHQHHPDDDEKQQELSSPSTDLLSGFFDQASSLNSANDEVQQQQQVQATPTPTTSEAPPPHAHEVLEPTAAPLVTATDKQVLQFRSKRALVIGNSTYQRCPLKNPGNDAKDMDALLRGMGFHVSCVYNGTHEQMHSAVDKFVASLEPQDCALFFFAGHGCQFDNVNYLIPCENPLTSLQSDFQLKHHAVSAQEVLDLMEERRVNATIMILDACRSYPLQRSSRSARDSFVDMNAAGSFIAFACKHGTTASDGRGRNGVFTAAILNSFKSTPVERRSAGLDVTNVFRAVKRSVAVETNNKQTPWTSDDLKKAVFL